MAKQGMSRPDWTHTHPKNEVPPVPQLQGKAKTRQIPSFPELLLLPRRYSIHAHIR